jgi:hypothetical protein
LHLQVVPVPKPRLLKISGKDLQRSQRLSSHSAMAAAKQVAAGATAAAPVAAKAILEDTTDYCIWDDSIHYELQVNLYL